jgi:hypothetical protein
MRPWFRYGLDRTVALGPYHPNHGTRFPFGWCLALAFFMAWYLVSESYQTKANSYASYAQQTTLWAVVQMAETPEGWSAGGQDNFRETGQVWGSQIPGLHPRYAKQD